MKPPPWAGTLTQRGDAVLLPTYSRYPLELASGQGCRVVDSGGRQYLDLVAGIAVSILGHGHPAVIQAIHTAAEGLLHVSNLYWTEPMIRLAERLTATARMERAFFCNSGAEAMEAAIKLARRARPGRPKLICFERSFHGRTLGALSLTAQPKYQDPFGPLLPGVETLPFGDFDAVTGSVDKTTAAVFVEPIQGEGGLRVAPIGWLQHLRDRCAAVGALLILDEVQCGLGRTGTFYAFHADGVLPDAVASAKALAAGLPMGVLLVRGEATEALRPGDHASTFGGGPFVAHVANVVLDVVLAPGFLQEVRAKGERLTADLSTIQRRSPLVLEVRGRGLMKGLALKQPVAKAVVGELQQRGVLACPAGPEVVRLVPPLTITREELEEGLEALEAALAVIEEKGVTA